MYVIVRDDEYDYSGPKGNIINISRRRCRHWQGDAEAAEALATEANRTGPAGSAPGSESPSPSGGK